MWRGRRAASCVPDERREPHSSRTSLVTTVNQHSAEADALLNSDSPAVRAGLQRLWDAARRAAEKIGSLQAENVSLKEKLSAVEAELADVREDLRKKEELIRKTLERPLPPAAKETGVHVNGDREALARQVQALLDKLDSYL